MSWFENMTGQDPENFGRYPPSFNYRKQLVPFRIKFLESHPHIVDTRDGLRAVIIIEVDKLRYTLWLSPNTFAKRIALLEKQLGDLHGKTVYVGSDGKEGYAFEYDGPLRDDSDDSLH
jgi:hypothetical protein